MRKRANRSIPRGRTWSGQPGRIVRPPYKTNNLRASGEQPGAIQLDTTYFNAFAERRKSPNPPKKVASKGTRRTVVRNDRELECWLDFRLNLTKMERVACEEARQKGLESFRVTQGCEGSIVEIFFKIDINTYTPQGKLSELENLTFSEVQTASENYLPISVPTGGFYLALDSNLQRLFVLFSDPYSLLYGPDVGKRVQNQVRENITDYTRVHPPPVPNNQRHKGYEQWLLENPEHCFCPESRCGVFHWGSWMERGHQSLGPVITSDTNKIGSRLRIHQHDLFTSFRNLSYLKRFLLGAIDKAERDKMQETIQALLPGQKELWCKSDTECFNLRACLVNVLTEPHVDSNDSEWAMISPFGKFKSGEFCIADLGRRFAFQEGHIAGIRGCRLVHFTREWVGSRICLVSTMHSALMRQCADSESQNSGEILSTKRGDGGDGTGGEKPAAKRVCRRSARGGGNGNYVSAPQ